MNKFYFCFLYALSAFYSNNIFAIENVYLRGDIRFSQSNSIKMSSCFIKKVERENLIMALHLL